MTEKNKYSAVEIVKEIVKSLKPKIDNDIRDLKKNGTTFLGGTQTSGQTGGILQGTKGAGTEPSIASQIGWNKSEVDAYVKKILSDKYQVQDVLKEVPKAMRDDVMSALRSKAGKKTYKGGLKKYMAKKHMEKMEKAESKTLSTDHFPTGHFHRGSKIVSAMHDSDNNMIHVRTEHGMMSNQTKTHSYDIKNPPKHAFDTQKNVSSIKKKAPEGVDPEAHERCVREVKQDVKPKGKDQTKIGSAHAICTASLKGKTNK